MDCDRLVSQQVGRFFKIGRQVDRMARAGRLVGRLNDWLVSWLVLMKVVG